MAQKGTRRGPCIRERQGCRGTEDRYDTSYSPTVLRRHGIAATAWLGRGRRVSLIRLNAAGGYQYWLGLRNFYVITRYNHSSYYAMAVHQLAQKLRSWRSSGKFALAQARTADR